jgi:hypothetical protein
VPPAPQPEIKTPEPPNPPPENATLTQASIRLEVTPVSPEGPLAIPTAFGPEWVTAASLSAPPPDVPLVEALRCTLAKHPAEAGHLLENYDPADRSVLLALLRLAAGIGEGGLERLPPQETAAALEQLQAVTRSLREHAPLRLGKVFFCHRIDGFGRYEPMPADRAFKAGSDGQPGERIQVYAEVRNFHCRPNGPVFETILASSLEIFSEQDRRRPVVIINPPTCRDRSLTPRQDYFLNFQFDVPARLPPGSYTLKVTVRDLTPPHGASVSPRVATLSQDFRITPP